MPQEYIHHKYFTMCSQNDLERGVVPFFVAGEHSTCGCGESEEKGNQRPEGQPARVTVLGGNPLATEAVSSDPKENHVKQEGQKTYDRG